MTAYLFAWNPKRWGWTSIEEEVANIAAGNEVVGRWSSGNSMRMHQGDRAFLIRLGQEPKGIMASGVIVTEPYFDLHWVESKAKLGIKTPFVDVRFDTLLDPERDEILPRALLMQPPLSTMRWDTQMSGVRIPDEVAAELEKAWEPYSRGLRHGPAEEVAPPEGIVEGAVRQITVNAYERSSEARSLCIKHYGTVCSVCGFDFGKVYGPDGDGLIHVHHLRPLAEAKGAYIVDPISEMRPVCPNCHAMIHRRATPYDIDEVREMIRQNRER